MAGDIPRRSTRQGITFSSAFGTVFLTYYLLQVTRDGLWPQITSQMGLPPTLPDGVTPTSNQVQELAAVFLDLEAFLRQLMQRRPPMPPNAIQNVAPSTDGSNSQSVVPILAAVGTPSDPPQPSSAGGGPGTPAQASDDSDSRKRKADIEDEETNRPKIRKVEEVCTFDLRLPL
jgi:hypothetical protein